MHFRQIGAWTGALLLILSAPVLAASLPHLPELRFAEIPEPSQPKYVGDRFSYMEAGRPGGTPIILLHGVGANSMHWRYQFDALDDDFRVIAWNAPGYMLSDGLKKDAPDCRDYADALLDFVTALRIGQFHIIGNSFGSRVAQCFVANYPNRVMRMALTGTAVGQRELSEDQKAQIIAAREKQIEKGGYNFGTGRVRSLIGPKASVDAVPLVQDILRGTNPRGFMQAVKSGLAGYYSVGFADRLTIPVLLIQGTEDKVTPMDKNAALLIKALPHGRLEVLEGYGHLPEIEAPDRVNALLKKFFAD